MKPYIDFSSKAKWLNFWNDVKINRRIKRIFKKSARRFKIEES